MQSKYYYGPLFGFLFAVVAELITLLLIALLGIDSARGRILIALSLVGGYALGIIVALSSMRQ